MGWPNIEVSETGNEVKVTAELPGLDEKDVDIRLSDGVLVIGGEKKTETEDKDRLFSERTYGRFERRIPLGRIEQPEDVAGMAAFLASSDSDYITQQTYNVDGGNWPS